MKEGMKGNGESRLASIRIYAIVVTVRLDFEFYNRVPSSYEQAILGKGTKVRKIHVSFCWLSI